MTAKVTFLVGSPGSGKTTLVRHLLGDLSACYLIPKPKWTVGENLVAAGHYTGATFDGADTVPYSGVKEALAFWDAQLSIKPWTVLDGDRFSYVGCADEFRALGARVLCVRLACTDFILAERREFRGSNQNATWLKASCPAMPKRKLKLSASVAVSSSLRKMSPV